MPFLVFCAQKRPALTDKQKEEAWKNFYKTMNIHVRPHPQVIQSSVNVFLCSSKMLGQMQDLFMLCSVRYKNVVVVGLQSSLEARSLLKRKLAPSQAHFIAHHWITMFRLANEACRECIRSPTDWDVGWRRQCWLAWLWTTVPFQVLNGLKRKASTFR